MLNKNNLLYPIILSILVIGIGFLYDSYFISHDTFNKKYEYSFIDKKSKRIKNKAADEYEKYKSSDDDEENIIALINSIECNNYLLNEDEISAKTYYYFIRSVLVASRKTVLYDKTKYTYEVDEFFNRKRKTNITYDKYELSIPQIFTDNGEEYAEVILIRTWSAKKDYLKCKFIKENNRWYYMDSKSINKLKEKG